MDFEEKSLLMDIKHSVAERRKVYDALPKVVVPHDIAVKLRNGYAKKLSKLYDRYDLLSDEPNKRLNVTKKIEVIEAFVEELDNAIQLWEKI
jgi:hypothetical protein